MRGPQTNTFSKYCEDKVKVKLCPRFFLTEHHATKTYWRVEVYIPAFLTSALGGGEWLASRPGRFTLQGKSPRASLDAVVRRQINALILTNMYYIYLVKA
jgi:hypothetical protein